MALTLLVENNSKIESFFVLNLLTWVGMETITKKNADFAIKFLENSAENVNLIICRVRISQEDTAEKIQQFLKARNLQIPLILIGKPDESKKDLCYIENSLNIKALVRESAKALGITAQEMINKVVPEFFPIPISYFLVIKRPICPVYARNIDDENKYDLRIQKLQNYEASYIEDLIREGIDLLYIDKMARLEFVQNVTSELIVTLASDELSTNEKLIANERGIELLSAKLMTIGITDETIKLAQKGMQDIIQTSKAYFKITDLVQELLKNQNSYLYQHTQLITYVAIHIIKNIDWGSQEQQEKIAFISLFHDIVLTSDEQAKIHSAYDFKKSNLTEEEKKLVDRHAMMAADIVAKYPRAPIGADQIIRQHHGQTNGIGFSETFGANISPLASVFIIAEAFTKIILSNKNSKINRDDALTDLKINYPSAKFSKIIDILYSITF